MWEDVKSKLIFISNTPLSLEISQNLTFSEFVLVNKLISEGEIISRKRREI